MEKPTKIEWTVVLLILGASASVIAGTDLIFGRGFALLALGGLLFGLAHMFATAAKKND